MSNNRSLTIVKCVGGASKAIDKYFMLETYPTSDGLRTRVCSGRWNTLSEAQLALDLKEGQPR